MTRQDVLDDTFIVLHVKHACELIFQPFIVIIYIYTDVLTILLFCTNKEGICSSKVAVQLLLICC